MWRSHGKPLTFSIVNQNEAKETAELGDIVALNRNGEVVLKPTGQEGAFFVLLDDVREEDTVANVTVYGIAKVKVEDAANINASTLVGLGATFTGVAEFSGTGYALGIALAKPAGDGDYIPVLLTHDKSDAIY